MKLHLFHNWILIQNNGVHKYFECSKCRLRKVKCGFPYQPVNLDLLFYPPLRLFRCLRENIINSKNLSVDEKITVWYDLVKMEHELLNKK